MIQLDNTILYLAKDKSKQFIHILKNLCPKIGIPLGSNLKYWTDNKSILSVYDTHISWWTCHCAYLNDEENIKNIPNSQLDWNKKIIPIYTYKDLFKIIGQLTDLIPDNNIKEVQEVAAKDNIFAPNNKDKNYINYPIVNKIYRDKSGKFAPKLPKNCNFVYLKDHIYTARYIKAVDIDKGYVYGYDLEDNNKYKQFLKSKIFGQINWEKK